MITVSEYADKHNISKSAVYYRIKQGQLETEKIDGVVHIVEQEQNQIIEVDKQYYSEQDEIIAYRNMLEDAIQQIRMSMVLYREKQSTKEKSDMRIRMLLEQLERKIEDLGHDIQKLDWKIDEKTKRLEDQIAQKKGVFLK
jgi:predicted DNA-binding protein YlxM (UPF0122 family)